MAGGMGGKREGPTLHERVHGTPPPSVEPPPVKPCWVTDHHGRLPGLLLEWRRTGVGWQGRVVRPMLEDGGWIVVMEWLGSDMLETG